MTRRILAMAAGLMMCLALVAAEPASARPPTTGTGTGVITDLDILSSRTVGPNRLEQRRLTGILTGALEGTFVEVVDGVVHRNGQVTFHGTLRFTGTVEGCGEGTVTARLQGRGEAGAAPVTDAIMRVVDQASATVPVTGGGTVHQDGAMLEYEVRYRCR